MNTVLKGTKLVFSNTFLNFCVIHITNCLWFRIEKNFLGRNGINEAGLLRYADITFVLVTVSGYYNAEFNVLKIAIFLKNNIWLNFPDK